MPVRDGRGRARFLLDRRREPEAPQLVVGCVLEDGLQRAARHRLAGPDLLERAHHARERQVEARRRAGRAARVQREHAAADVEDRRAGGTAGSARRRLQVERVEVVVAAEPVLRGLAVEARERASEDRELLARVIAHDADLDADLGALGEERQLRRLDEAQLRRVVAIKAEVVHGVAVHGLELDLLAIQEGREGLDRPRRHHVAVGQDDAALGIHHETRGLRRSVPLGVEGARHVDLDRDHAGRDALERARPARGLLELERLRQRHHRDLRRHDRRLVRGRLQRGRRWRLGRVGPGSDCGCGCCCGGGGRRRQGLRLRHLLCARERRRKNEDDGCDCEPRGLALSPAGTRMFHEIDP